MNGHFMSGVIRVSACLLLLAGCGGGGGGDSQCSTDGFPLACTAANACCPNGFPYLCETNINPDGFVCSTAPCPIQVRTLDFCGEE